MVVRRRTGTHSFAEFLELIREDQKADLLDGGIYMASPESVEHNDLIRWLVMVLGACVEERGLGQVFVNRVAFRLAKDSAPEPDVAVVLTGRLAQLRSGYVDGPPDLAIEVVSPESAERDYEHKRTLYERHGVAEYWIIDPAEQLATFLVREGERLVEGRVTDGAFTSHVLKGLRIEPAWLLQRPLPATRGIVDRILVGMG
jgi:Uma2 family endonuclease